jgi:thiosulfate/3-mercaptopyruvate sulfurtransferase
MLAMISLDAAAIPNGYDLVDATAVLPSWTDPFDDYLSSTTHSIDMAAIKAFPIDKRLSGAAKVFGQCGLRGEQPVAVYDRAGLFSAPWVWWMLRSHGCKAVLVEGWGDTVSKGPQTTASFFGSSANHAIMNASKDDVLAALGTEIQIIDARPAARFAGDAKEPRPGCRAGHIPGSVNIPFPTLKSGRSFKSEEALWDIFDDQEIDLSSPIITTCGSGVTASGLAFALTRCGAKHVRVYQGSWSEWGPDETLPIEMGE